MELFKKVLHIPDKNITFLKDATYDEIDECYDKLKKLYNTAMKAGGPPTLFVIWYGGHGEMGGSAFTQICCNSQDKNLRLYRFEE